MTSNKRDILRRAIVIFSVFGFLFALIFIILFSKVAFDVGVKCPFYELLNWYCPLCGGTRMAVALLQGDILLALQNNALIILTLPVLLYVFCKQAYLFIRYGTLLEWLDKFLVTYILVFILFAILRNFEIFSWLAPKGS